MKTLDEIIEARNRRRQLLEYNDYPMVEQKEEEYLLALLLELKQRREQGTELTLEMVREIYEWWHGYGCYSACDGCERETSCKGARDWLNAQRKRLKG